MGFARKLTGIVALVAIGAAVPAEARCWNAGEASAARVRQMQTMLMVATLRCRAAGIDMTADYDGFVATQRDAITAANLVIKQHFADAGGSQADYDHFATTLANGYGDDATTEASCAEAAAFAHEAAAAASTALNSLAAARLFPAALPGGGCVGPAASAPAAATASVAIAAAKPAEALPPILRLAAPEPDSPRPVTLPDDVVAAMTVLARYQVAQAAQPSAPRPVSLAAMAR